MILGGNGTSTAGQIKVDNTVNSTGGLTFGSTTEAPTLTLSGSGLLINSVGSTATAPTFTMAGGTLGLGSSNGAFTLNTGTYTQTGGGVSETGAGISYIANGSSTYTSVFNLSGGTFTVGTGNFYNAVRGTGTINLSGTGSLNGTGVHDGIWRQRESRTQQMRRLTLVTAPPGALSLPMRS